jgi:hypothetical protein
LLWLLDKYCEYLSGCILADAYKFSGSVFGKSFEIKSYKFLGGNLMLSKIFIPGILVLLFYSPLLLVLLPKTSSLPSGMVIPVHSCRSLVSPVVPSVYSSGLIPPVRCVVVNGICEIVK